MLEVLAFSLLLLGKDEPVLDPARDQPAPPNAAFYSDCFRDAAERGNLKAQNGYLLLSCQGEPAKRFYDKLGTLPASATHSETRASVTLRYTTRPKKDTDGLDACWQDSQAAGTEFEYGCRLIYPAGPLLDAD
ncbi:MAG: hypothetical protein EON95_13255 [Caulobacteraceae bacterium]|nr:MAG: hypothetical protein EON95_13255 [Caulobacteraceae bacterium]